MTAHRAWRLSYVSTPRGYCSTATLEMRGVAGGPDLTQGATGVAIADSAYSGYPAANAFDNNAGTFWTNTNQSGLRYLGWDFGAGNAVAINEIAYMGRNDGYCDQDSPRPGMFQYSDDAVNWTDAHDVVAPTTYVGGTTYLFDVSTGPAPPAAGLESSEARTFAIVKQVAASEQMSAARTFTIVTLASQREDVSQERLITVVKRNSIMEQSGSRVFAIVKGHTANPLVRAWTFTLDGHDFYVLNLGDDLTLLYDVYSEQWVEWDSGGPNWRANTGINWIGAQGLARTFGTNVLVGDNEFGILWFLDPLQAWDENPVEGGPILSFDRVVTGQVLASGRDFKPCYAIFVDGDNYGLTAADFTPVVYLETSDDQGRTFTEHSYLEVTASPSDNNPYAWYSLGQISSPGRMFRVRDNGVFARIDSMDMNDGG